MTDFSRYDDLEKQGLSSVRKVQEELLAGHLAHLSQNSPFYRELFKSQKIAVDKVCLDNLSELPFTDKADMARNINDFLATPMRNISDIVITSGTTGDPTRIMYSEKDMLRLAYNEKTALARVGITSDDIVLLTCTMERCFIAGQAYYLGVRAIGAAAVRNGQNSLASHIEMLYKMTPTVLIGVPSFLRKLGLFLVEQGGKPADTSVKKLVCIGEPIRDKNLKINTLGSALEGIWGAEVFSTYASSETITTFCECSNRMGGHLHPALGYVEIVNDDGKVVPPGEAGEVVMTPFMIEGMPILRFKTGDVSFLIDGPCSCGRTSLRLGPILGRKKQMIKFHGTSLYPQSIFSSLDEIKEVGEYYVVVSSDYELSDKLEVHLSLKDGSISSDEIASRLQAALRVKPTVIISDEKEIKNIVYNTDVRKPVRFLDKRG